MYKRPQKERILISSHLSMFYDLQAEIPANTYYSSTQNVYNLAQFILFHKQYKSYYFQ